MANPVYLKIAEDLKHLINSGQLKPGDNIPSEAELCKKYGTSRMTVRKGLALLANNGYIYSIPGKGNFVQRPQTDKYVIYYDEKKNQINSVDRSKLLEVNIIMPDEHLANELQVSRNKKVIVIRRLFYTEGNPVAYDLKYLLYHKGMPLVEKEIEHASFFEMFSNTLPMFELKKELIIYAQAPEDEIKHYLNIYNDLPVLVVEQKLYNDQGQPMGLGITYYRGDYIKIQGFSA